MMIQRVISVSPLLPVPQSVVEDCRAVLADGALVVVPTETVYGIIADARNKDSEKRLFAAKRRSGAKPIAIFARDCAQIERLGGRLGPLGRKLAELYWPGPLTMVIPVVSSIHDCIHSEFEGFRVPDHPVALSLLKAFDFPLRATSANIAGEPPALTAESAMKALGDSVALVLDSGPVPVGLPSTVVKVEARALRILREGAIPVDDIRSCLPCKDEK